MSATPTAELRAPVEVRLRRGFDPAALAALAVLTLRQNLRGRRLLVLSLLFLLPTVLVGAIELSANWRSLPPGTVSYPPPQAMLEFAFVLTLIPHALAPLTALLYAAGIIQDEVEEQTLTYLLLRPLPRWALYLTKLAVTWLTTSILTGFFTTLTLVVIYWNTPELWGEVLPGRAARVVALMALAQAGYCSLFGVLGLLTRRSLIAGLAYIIAFEGMLANFDAVVRRLTVMYYFRVLSIHWLDLRKSKEWSIDLALAPSASEVVLMLLSASAVFALLGAVMMTRREFPMKTAAGS